MLMVAPDSNLTRQPGWMVSVASPPTVMLPVTTCTGSMLVQVTLSA